MLDFEIKIEKIAVPPRRTRSRVRIRQVLRELKPRTSFLAPADRRKTIDNAMRAVEIETGGHYNIIDDPKNPGMIRVGRVR